MYIFFLWVRQGWNVRTKKKINFVVAFLLMIQNAKDTNVLWMREWVNTFITSPILGPSTQ